MSNKSEVWVFKKHTNNIQLLIEVATYLKANKAGISKADKDAMYDSLMQTDWYNPRDSKRNKPLDSINHKLDALYYFMFGYKSKLNGQDKFIFSPLGNLFLININDKIKLSKIFSTMLIGLQFPHPASKPSESFSLYPFRLIFQLLLDKRLQGRLYHYEVYEFIIHTKNLTRDEYEDIVFKILNSRTKTWTDKFLNLYKKQYEIVKSVYEWQYYITPLLSSLNIFTINNGDIVQKLYHPSNENSKSLPTPRRANNGYIEINSDLKKFICMLLSEYSIYSKPISLQESEKNSTDVIKEIYAFYPDVLLEEINEKPTVESRILEIPKLVTEYANNPDNNTSGKFEHILEEAFNLFVDVDAHWLAGAGRTDIECLYMAINEKFSIEAKSTKNKLSMINAGRLKRHRELIGARYTIVVTSRYVPSVRYDIDGQNIVLITANTLSEYLYNNIISNNREISYTEVHNIITNNLGTDISLHISNLTLSKFG